MVKYEDSSHTYYTEDVEGKRINYISVTTLLGLFKEPFNSKVIATRLANRDGGKPEDYIAKWEKIKQDACLKGTALHNEEEAKLYKANASTTFNVEDKQIDYSKLPNGVYPELKLWNHEFKIAGRTDKVTIYTDPNNGCSTIDIDDHKTGKPIDFVSYKYPNGNYKMMYRPIQHLMDCKYIQYSLQLSLYAYMLECMGYKVGKLNILYHGIEKLTIPVTYLKQDVLKILTQYANESKYKEASK